MTLCFVSTNFLISCTMTRLCYLSKQYFYNDGHCWPLLPLVNLFILITMNWQFCRVDSLTERLVPRVGFEWVPAISHGRTIGELRGVKRLIATRRSEPSGGRRHLLSTVMLQRIIVGRVVEPDNAIVVYRCVPVPGMNVQIGHAELIGLGIPVDVRGWTVIVETV